MFPIVPMRPRSDAQHGILHGVLGITVTGMADVAYRVRRGRDNNDPYQMPQEAQVVGIA